MVRLLKLRCDNTTQDDTAYNARVQNGRTLCDDGVGSRVPACRPKSSVRIYKYVNVESCTAKASQWTRWQRGTLQTGL